MNEQIVLFICPSCRRRWTGYLSGKNEERERTLLQTLMKHVEKDEEISASQICGWMKEEYGDEAKWLNSIWVGMALKRLGFSDSRKLSRLGGRHFYTIRKDFLHQVAKRTGLAAETGT